MPKTFSLSIPAGTIVFRNVNGQCQKVPLIADVDVDGAIQQKDGSFAYRVGKHEYCASSGTVQIV